MASLMRPDAEEKDRKDLIEFGVPQGVDFVAASFVQDCQVADLQVFAPLFCMHHRLGGCQGCQAYPRYPWNARTFSEDHLQD